MTRYQLKSQSVNLARLQVSQVRLSRKLFPRKCTSRGALDFSFHRISTSKSQFPRFPSDFRETEQVYTVEASKSLSATLFSSTTSRAGPGTYYRQVERAPGQYFDPVRNFKVYCTCIFKRK